MRLSENMKSLTKNIINSKNVRGNEIKKIAADAKKITVDTKKALEGFAGEDKIRASDLRKDLKSVKPELKKNVSSMISGFAEADKARASDLRKDLKSSKLELKKNVSSLLDDYKSDRVGAANIWRTMTNTLDKKHATSVVQPEQKKTEPKKEPEVKPVEKPVAAPDFETPVLKIVQKNPHGIEIERIRNFTGVPAAKLDIIISKLFADGKINKKGNKYFPGKR